jgi:hypothetical protein
MWVPPTGQLKSYHVVVGKVPSLNAFYASKHWTVRAKAKDKHCGEVLAQLEKYDKYELKNVNIKCKVNYRYDIDNSIMAVKFALDAFRKWGGVKDDSRAYVRKLKLEHDPDIHPDTAEITFTGLLVNQ